MGEQRVVVSTTRKPTQPRLSSEVNNLASVLLQNHRALPTPTAQGGGACASTGRKCCLYVTQTEQVTANLTLLEQNISMFHQIKFTPFIGLTYLSADLLPVYNLLVSPQSPAQLLIYETIKEVSEEETDRVQGRLLQDADYFS
nr:endogenous retrovirus group FC1 Env polyprotein-like [Camelus dromedarius]